jgi:hypothetical protein
LCVAGDLTHTRRNRRLKRRAWRGLFVQVIGFLCFFAVACEFATRGDWVAAGVFAFVALVPVGGAFAWGYIVRNLPTRR